MKIESEQAAEAHRKALNRLKRARGQLNAVIDNFERGGDCKEVITQLSAVTSALDKAGFTIISAALENCLNQEGPEAELTPEELEKLFLMLA